MKELRFIRRLFQHELSADRVAGHVRDELRFHFDMTVGELMNRGYSEDDARKEAERRFGNLDETRARLEAIDRDRARQAWVVSAWNAMTQDVRYALRGLRLHPGFTAVIVVTLALGIGANATIFGVIDRLLLRPPAYMTAPERTHRLYLARTLRDGTERIDNNNNYKRFTELRDSSTTTDVVAARFEMEIPVGEGDGVQTVQTEMATRGYWSLFDAKPVIGRWLDDADDAPTAEPAAVIGYAFWQSRYAGKRDAVGQQIRVGGKKYTIVGVAPRGFTGMSVKRVAVFVPLNVIGPDMFSGYDRNDYGYSWLEIVARRKPGVSLERVKTDLTSTFWRSYEQQIAGIAGARPMAQINPRVMVESILLERGPRKSQDAKVTTWLAGVSIIVLLIACANVANLLLSRAVRRRREIAVRVAIGAGRGRLVNQLMTESLVLALIGAVAGLVVAQWGGTILRATLLPQVEWDNMLFDGRVLGATLIVSLLTGLLAGLVPALQTLRPRLTESLKAGGREGGRVRTRTRTSLLLVQGTLSVILLVGAGLFVRSLRNVRAIHLGYDPANILVLRVQPRGVTMDSAETRILNQRIAERAASIPGVEASAESATIPFWMNMVQDLFAPDVDSVNAKGDFYYHAVTPDYFRAMGTKIVRGRGIEATDVAGSEPVMVITQQMGEAIWPKQDPIGKCLKVDTIVSPCRRIVGIAEGIVRGGIDETVLLQYYVSARQVARPGANIVVRTTANANTMRETVRRDVQKILPGAAVLDIRPLQDMIDVNLRSWDLGAKMFSLFGGLALVLAALGLYSVISYSVAQRMHEMGVRVALGARGGDLVRLVLSEGMRVIVVAMALGIGAAYWGAKWIAPLLFKVDSRDPAVYGAVGAMLMVVAILAAVVPARRAARVDPNIALRAD